MTRRKIHSIAPGLTLIETLVAMVLLSGVAVATTALLRSVSSVHGEVTPALRWATHADRTLQCVADDAVIGDRSSRDRDIVVNNNELSIHTRGPIPDGTIGRIEVRFMLPTGSGRLIRSVQSLDNRDRPVGRAEHQVLLGSVDAFAIEPIQTAEPLQSGGAQPLAYALELRSGDITVRRVIYP